jgi:hypothetical protein
MAYEAHEAAQSSPPAPISRATVRGGSIMSEPTEIVQRVTRALACSACGAAGEANCDCGAPYLPASARAAKAIIENPGRSDRSIAAEIGVSDRTVNRARGSTATHDAVEKRVGADGRSRKQPAKLVNGLNAVGKPFSPQYDPNYKVRGARAPVKAPDRGRGDVAEDMLDILSGLNKNRRTDFFRALWDKFRDELIEAQTVSYERQIPNHDASWYRTLLGRKNKPKAETSAVTSGPAA